jgi:hypothetical protein
VYGGNQKPTEFLSLALKLLVLQPEKAILLEYLKAEEFKYVPPLFLSLFISRSSHVRCVRNATVADDALRGFVVLFE